MGQLAKDRINIRSSIRPMAHFMPGLLTLHLDLETTLRVTSRNFFYLPFLNKAVVTTRLHETRASYKYCTCDQPERTDRQTSGQSAMCNEASTL